MHHVAAPEHGNLVAEAVVPVVREIIEQQRSDPSQNAVASPFGKVEPLVDRDIEGDVDDLGEAADDLAQHAVVHAGDGIGQVIDVAPSHPPRDRRLDKNGGHEQRYCEQYNFHAVPLSPREITCEILRQVNDGISCPPDAWSRSIPATVAPGAANSPPNLKASG